MSLLPLLILVVLGSLGTLVYLHFKRVGPAKAAASWPAAPGIMLATTVREPGPGAAPKYQPLVHYRYSVGGRDFEGVQLRFGDTATFDRNKAYADIAPYPPGAPIHVRYNPHRPEESVLELARVSSPFLWIAGGLLLAMVLAIGAIAAVESGLFDDDTPAYRPWTSPTMNDMSSAMPPAAAPRRINDHATALIGRWSRSGDCSRAMQFLADGTIINPGGARGTWQAAPVSARQSMLTISGGGSTVRAWLDPIGTSAFEVTPMDSSGQFTITRCL